MIELMPNLSQRPQGGKLKKSSWCAQARYLLSAVYTNDELVESGNLSGARNKKGLHTTFSFNYSYNLSTKVPTEIHFINIYFKIKDI